MHDTSTRSPSFTLRTASPVATTVPTASWPSGAPVGDGRHVALQDVQVGAADRRRVDPDDRVRRLAYGPDRASTPSACRRARGRPVPACVPPLVWLFRGRRQDGSAGSLSATLRVALAQRGLLIHRAAGLDSAIPASARKRATAEPGLEPDHLQLLKPKPAAPSRSAQRSRTARGTGIAARTVNGATHATAATAGEPPSFSGSIPSSLARHGGGAAIRARPRHDAENYGTGDGRARRDVPGLHRDAKARSLTAMAARRLRRAGRPAATV